jgi:hypothetical protein
MGTIMRATTHNTNGLDGSANNNNNNNNKVILRSCVHSVLRARIVVCKVTVYLG